VVLFYQALQGQKTQYLTRQLVTAPGGALGDFPKFFQGVPKVVKFGFHPSKLKKQPFFSNFENPGGPWPPSDAHASNTTGITCLVLPDY